MELLLGLRKVGGDDRFKLDQRSIIGMLDAQWGYAVLVNTVH